MYQEPQTEQDEPDGLWSRFTRFTSGITRGISGEADEEDDMFDERQREERHPEPAPRQRRDTFRIASTRESSISVMPVGTFADIQKAADRLKSGEPQIINLEKAPAEVAERLIDFLNGVTYALDGYVEKIAEGAYLFTPSHITIHAEGSEPPQRSTFFDR